MSFTQATLAAEPTPLGQSYSPKRIFAPLGNSVLQAIESDVGVTQSAGLISAWDDISGKALPYSGSAKPAFLYNELNGLPVAKFSTTNELLTSGLILASPAVTLTWMYWCMRIDVWTAAGAADLYFLPATGAGPAIVNDAVSPQIHMQSTTAANINSNATVGTWVRCYARFNNSIMDYMKVGSAAAVTGQSAGGIGGSFAQQIGLGSGRTAQFSLANLCYANADPSALVIAQMDAIVTAKYNGLVLV